MSQNKYEGVRKISILEHIFESLQSLYLLDFGFVNLIKKVCIDYLYLQGREKFLPHACHLSEQNFCNFY